MDAETYLNAQEGEKFQRINESETWAEIKGILTEKIMDLQSIRNLTDTDPEQIIIDLKARNYSIDTLLALIRDIEGRAEQHKANKPLIEDYITYENS